MYSVQLNCSTRPVSKSADLKPSLMKDLCVRHYLFSFDKEKYVLRVICMSVSGKSPIRDPSSLGEVDPEDSRALARIHPANTLARLRGYYCPDVRFRYQGLGSELRVKNLAPGSFHPGRKFGNRWENHKFPVVDSGQENTSAISCLLTRSLSHIH